VTSAFGSLDRSILDRFRVAFAEMLARTNRIGRDRRVIAGVCAMAPSADSMLDVGCSDGRIASAVARRLKVGTVRGIDVQLQPNAQIEVLEYDGSHFPFEGASFELVTIVDVLHHTEDPSAVLRESLRVLRRDGRIVIKDHVRLGHWSSAVLYLMDSAANFGEHALATGHYLSLGDWVSTVTAAGGHIEKMVYPFRVNSLPWSLIARSQYQVVFRVRHEAAA
jgi:SAM-dependent methyltransferase